MVGRRREGEARRAGTRARVRSWWGRASRSMSAKYPLCYKFVEKVGLASVSADAL